ncbi:hypothetical protein GDO81_018258 [Engystomops pustulosus]|uniref:Uncharacterized protein n=1 Tax=Engystomops pustulosus TaxID=76066 RepID=A0AAV7AAL7_ENGPU|nr:hypothetical protein GDO81_018258 [Engystomops pustulosus]
MEAWKKVYLTHITSNAYFCFHKKLESLDGQFSNSLNALITTAPPERGSTPKGKILTPPSIGIGSPASHGLSMYRLPESRDALWLKARCCFWQTEWGTF